LETENGNAPEGFDSFEIWCDKNADKVLIDSLKHVSPFLQGVENVRVLPSTATVNRSPDLAYLRPLIKYDRADLLILRDKHPVLIVEMTEHGYTGDHCMQRFARLASAGEERIPVLYFTPFSRTRLDELEETDEKTSKRNVSLHLFQGMKRIREIHGVPIIAIDWPVNTRGLPRKASSSATAEEKTRIYGELLGLMEHIARKHSGGPDRHPSLRRCKAIREALAKMDAQAATVSARDSEIRFIGVPFQTVAEIIHRPSNMISLVGRDYFFKGKDHKLIALLCLMNSQIRTVENINGNHVMQNANGLRQIPQSVKRRPSVIHYCGFEKRSEPNGGIIVNTDYLFCRTGPTVLDRSQNLVLVWPRVFFHSDNHVANSLRLDLRDTVKGSQDTALAGLILEKVRREKADPADHRYIANTKSSIGFWKETDTIGRICRKFCDLIILNDAVLLGDHWKTTSRANGALDGWLGM